MTYSITVCAPTKDEVKNKLDDRLDTLVETQPSHRTDADQARDAAGRMIDALVDDPTKDVCVSVAGHVRMAAGSNKPELVGFSVSAYFMPR